MRLFQENHIIETSAQDPDPQKYADPLILIQGAKYQPKTATKKNVTIKTKVLTIKKSENIKIS